MCLPAGRVPRRTRIWLACKWPDGTIRSEYQFRHALFHVALYRRLGSGRLARLHRAIGLELEKAWGDRAPETAAELALHFEWGRDVERAVGYRRQAATNALQRWAYPEALDHIARGLHLIGTGASGPDERAQERELQIQRGSVLIATPGSRLPDVARAFDRARELCEPGEDSSELFTVLRGQWFSHLNRGKLRAALPWGRSSWPWRSSGTTRGSWWKPTEPWRRPPRFWESCRRLGPTLSEVSGPVPSPGASNARVASWPGPRRRVPGLRRVRPVAPRIRRPGARPGSPGRGAGPGAGSSLRGGDGPLHAGGRASAAARGGDRDAEAEAAVQLSTDLGFPLYDAWGREVHGWALVVQGRAEEGIGQMERGLLATEAIGAELYRPYFLARLAEAHASLGQIESGAPVAAEGAAGRREERGAHLGGRDPPPPG